MAVRTLIAFLTTVLPAATSAQQPAPTVTSEQPHWRSTEQWAVGAQPTVTIGKQDGAEHLLFDRIVAVLLADDRILVGDGGTRTIRVFSRSGELTHSFSREGEGPGELRDLTRLWLDTDGSPVAYDARLKRLTIFRSTQPLIVPVRGATAFVTPYGRMRNGLFVTGTPQRTLLGGSPGDILRDSTTIWVGAEEHREVERVANRSRMVFGTAEWIRYPFLPLTVGPAIAVGEAGFVIGDGSSPHLRYYDQDGRLVRTVQWMPRRQSVTSSVRSDVGDMLVAAQRDQAAWRRFARDVPYPELVPVFDRIALDASGVTWVRNYDYTNAAPEIWTVIAADGRWLGDMTLPRDFEATYFGETSIAGILRDDLGVERAAVFPLVR